MLLARCPWYVAGPLLGVLIVALRATVNKPFGALGGYIDLVDNASAPRRIGFRGSLLAGLALGGLLFALSSRSFAPSFDYARAGHLLPHGTAVSAAVLVIAGIAMGFGARTAGGCTSGHGMSGTSLGSPASIVATLTFFGAGVATALGLALLSGGGR